MRKIVYHIATSIDGFIASTDGTVNNFLMEGEHAEAFVNSLARYDTVLMGRRTYEFGFQFGLEPGQPAYPNLKHIIVSQTMQFASNDTVHLLANDVSGYVQRLKSEVGKDIWLCGGGQLAGYLLSHDLIDEVVLKVNPIILGEGRPLFAEVTTRPSLRLTSTHPYPNGVVLLSYVV